MNPENNSVKRETVSADLAQGNKHALNTAEDEELLYLGAVKTKLQDALEKIKEQLANIV